MTIEKNIPQNNEEKGATMVEYALMVALLAVALIAAVQTLRNDVSSTFSATGSAIQVG